MNLRSLRVFVRVMEVGTLARAAAGLHMSESAGSRQLQLLELELRTSLFMRETKRLVPTAAAEALLPEALQILSQIDGLSSLVGAAGNPTRQPLRIVCHARVMNGLVLPAIVQLAKDRPGTEVTLDVQPRRDLGRRMMQGLFDIGVSALPSPTEGLEPIVLGSVPLGVLVAKDHPLAGRKKVDTADLNGLPYIALDETTVIRRMIDTTLAAAGQKLQVTFEMATGDAAYHLVRDGLGYTFSDRIALDPRLDGIVLVPWTQSVTISYGLFVGASVRHAAVPLMQAALQRITAQRLES